MKVPVRSCCFGVPAVVHSRTIPFNVYGPQSTVVSCACNGGIEHSAVQTLSATTPKGRMEDSCRGSTPFTRRSFSDVPEMPFDQPSAALFPDLALFPERTLPVRRSLRFSKADVRHQDPDLCRVRRPKVHLRGVGELEVE